jgi:hypothetical protein
LEMGVLKTICLDWLKPQSFQSPPLK